MSGVEPSFHVAHDLQQFTKNIYRRKYSNYRGSHRLTQVVCAFMMILQ